ncbi:acyl-CoA dehydrogenase family protein [Oricola indica]|jgi:acyl-CoA dehydrogenase|uniref:acyl-CoA dehydrogenase family protein n=1 Tax=Oricola indica TaxID=2872591 RepID=UPI001CBDB282|nr:acyl-CoA dehydrogenase family protein [Oricola indica]
MAVDKETLDQLLAVVRRFVDERLIPAERKVEELNDIPEDILSEMKELGLFGLTIPETYGGMGLGMEDEARVIYEIGRAHGSYRSAFATTIGIGSQGIVIDGTDAQKDRYLPLMATGEMIGSFALTEPGSGSDAAALRTNAVKDGDHYVLNGSKRFITNAPRAGVFTVMARTDPDNKGAGGITAFAVDADLEGLSVGKPDSKLGHHGTLTADVNFDNVRVPAEAIIGGVPGMGFKTAMKVLDRGRLHIAAAACGAADRLIEECLRYAMEREQFGKPIAEFQLVQAMLADSRTEAYAAWCMVLDAAKRRDAGERVTVESSCAKYFATEMVGRVADRAVQIFGGAGYIVDYPIERFYRDVRLYRIYEGTSQIQQLIIARDMIKNAS